MRYLLSLILVISFSSVSYSSSEYGKIRCYITGINNVHNFDKFETEKVFGTYSLNETIYANHTIDLLWNNKNFVVVHNDNKGKKIEEDDFPITFPSINDMIKENATINSDSSETGSYFYINIRSIPTSSPRHLNVISLSDGLIEIIDSAKTGYTKRLLLHNFQDKWRGFLTIDTFGIGVMMLEVVGLECNHQGKELKILTQTYN